jgi:NADH-quinone oxidoreductase subunit H
VRVPLQLATFLAKVALLCVVQIQIRWSLPRFRYDQMLGLSWKLLLPVSLANLAVTVLVAWWQGGAR